MNSYILNLNNLKFIFISSSSGSACFCIKGVIVSAIGFGQIVSSIHPALAPSGIISEHNSGCQWIEGWVRIDDGTFE
jgi:hypothetical protein